MNYIKINEPPKIISYLYKKGTSEQPDVLIGEIYCDWQLNDCRIQIAKEYNIATNMYDKNVEVSDYYFIWNGIAIPVLKNGRIVKWLDGFYDLSEKQSAELFKLH